MRAAPGIVLRLTDHTCHYRVVPSILPIRARAFPQCELPKASGPSCTLLPVPHKWHFRSRDEMDLGSRGRDGPEALGTWGTRETPERQRGVTRSSVSSPGRKPGDGSVRVWNYIHLAPCTTSAARRRTSDPLLARVFYPWRWRGSAIRARRPLGLYITAVPHSVVQACRHRPRRLSKCSNALRPILLVVDPVFPAHGPKLALRLSHGRGSDTVWIWHGSQIRASERGFVSA